MYVCIYIYIYTPIYVLIWGRQRVEEEAEVDVRRELPDEELEDVKPARRTFDIYIYICMYR